MGNREVVTVLLCAEGPDCVSLSHFLSVASLRWFKGMLHAGIVLYPAICKRTIVLRPPWSPRTRRRDGDIWNGD